jgi:hypothetical protein
MAQSAQIIYVIPTSPPTTKTISLSKPRLFINDPFIPREIQVSLTGDTETILYPRMDIKIRAEFSESRDQSLRRNITNWWQWAQRGNPFKFAFDSNKKVMTTTTAGAEIVGDVAVDVISDTGITVGQQYVIQADNYYQLVTPTFISAGNITIDDPLNTGFPPFAVFRDQFYWSCIIRDPDQRSPIEDLGVGDDLEFGAWRFAFDFYEDVA